jgi:hypothetical protein
MRRFSNPMVIALAMIGLGCSDRDTSPTSPHLGPAAVVSACDLSSARNLSNQLFPQSAQRIAQDSIQVIQNAGAGTAAATDAGFGILELVSIHGPASPQVGSDLANAILPCMSVGSTPTDFTAALGSTGAFAVRGSSSTNSAAAVSHDGVWGMEPPLDLATSTRLTWNAVTVPANKRILVFGAPITDPDFTDEEQVGTIFDWFTFPTVTFNPGVVVGTCIIDGGPQYLVQHLAQGDIVPSATPSFCPSAATSQKDLGEWSPSALAQRLLRFFSPRPLLATALGTRPPGGSIGSLSPSVAVDPGAITLDFPGQIADGRTFQVIRFKDGSAVRVTVEPDGGTDLDGAMVELVPVNNLGTPVVATGNTAVTTDGVATFPSLTLSKAGGYRFVAKITGFGQNNAAGFNIIQDVSNGFNIRQSK